MILVQAHILTEDDQIVTKQIECNFTNNIFSAIITLVESFHSQQDNKDIYIYVSGKLRYHFTKDE